MNSIERAQLAVLTLLWGRACMEHRDAVEQDLKLFEGIRPTDTREAVDRMVASGMLIESENTVALPMWSEAYSAVERYESVRRELLGLAGAEQIRVELKPREEDVLAMMVLDLWGEEITLATLGREIGSTRRLKIQRAVEGLIGHGAVRRSPLGVLSVTGPGLELFRRARVQRVPHAWT